jgi:ACS family tartrate transporter-like MFS transporter
VAVSLASVVMGIVSAPILELDGTFGLHGWQWLLLIEGIPAVVMGGVVFALLPDAPAAAIWLAPDERRWLESALAADAERMAATEHGSVLRAISDPLVLMFGIGFLCIVGVNNAFVLSTPQILAAKTGFDIAAVGLVVALGGALGAIALLANAWHSDRAGERFWHIVIPAIIMGTAYVVLAFSTTPVVVVLCFLVAVMSSIALQPVFWAAVSQTLHRRHLAVGAAAVNTIAQLGAFLSPIAFGIARDATGSYDLGIALLPISFFAAAAIFNHIRVRVARPGVVLPA